jgi:hypothetical protein
MTSDDVYRAKLRKTAADLRQAVAPLDGFAKVALETSEQGVRLVLVPLTAGACPVELMVRADQKYDIAVGVLLYEDRPVERLELFKPLILAVVDGAVVERRTVSALTGMEAGRETIVTLADGSQWRAGGQAREGDGEEWIAEDREFLPYRR